MVSKEDGATGDEGANGPPPPPPPPGPSTIAAAGIASNENNKRPAADDGAAAAAGASGDGGEPPRRRARKSRWEEAPEPSTLPPPPPPMPPPTFSSMMPPGVLPQPPQRSGQVSMPHVSAAATSALTLAAASGARELTLPGGIVVQLPSAVVGGPAQKSDDPAVLALYGELADAERRLREDDWQIPPSPQRSPSPEPVYDRRGIRLNTREVRARENLSERRQDLIEQLIKSDRSYRPPYDYRPQKKRKKLYIPQKKYPNFNFIGLVIGPRGKTQRELQAQTGCRVVIRGRGAMKEGAARAPGHDYGEDDDLHVLIEGKREESQRGERTKRRKRKEGNRDERDNERAKKNRKNENNSLSFPNLESKNKNKNPHKKNRRHPRGRGARREEGRAHARPGERLVPRHQGQAAPRAGHHQRYAQGGRGRRLLPLRRLGPPPVRVPLARRRRQRGRGRCFQASDRDPGQRRGAVRPRRGEDAGGRRRRRSRRRRERRRVQKLSGGARWRRRERRRRRRRGRAPPSPQLWRPALLSPQLLPAKHAARPLRQRPRLRRRRRRAPLGGRRRPERVQALSGEPRALGRRRDAAARPRGGAPGPRPRRRFRRRRGARGPRRWQEPGRPPCGRARAEEPRLRVRGHGLARGRGRRLPASARRARRGAPPAGAAPRRRSPASGGAFGGVPAPGSV